MNVWNLMDKSSRNINELTFLYMNLRWLMSCSMLLKCKYWHERVKQGHTRVISFSFEARFVANFVVIFYFLTFITIFQLQNMKFERIQYIEGSTMGRNFVLRWSYIIRLHCCILSNKNELKLIRVVFYPQKNAITRLHR